jgi:hypothetical protein
VKDAVIADVSAPVSSSETPRSAVSAAVRRQGLCATPPIASRAERMRLPSVAIAAAINDLPPGFPERIVSSVIEGVRQRLRLFAHATASA